jgi:hypothetical protein
MDLAQQTSSYLAAERYHVVDRGGGLLVGTRAAIGGGSESIYVWVMQPSSPEELRYRERSLLTAFGVANEIAPAVRKFLLLPSYHGLSPEFRKDAKRWFNVTVTVPGFFFDTDFSWDVSREARTAARNLQERGEATRRRRISQPFKTTDRDAAGDDLLPVLLSRLSLHSSGPNVHIVVGPAGAGKTILFETLYAELYGRFLENKRAQVLSPRPLPLLPEYLAGSDAATVRALVRSFLRTDFVRPLDLPMFEWMVTNGAAMWLLDGLDEVIAQDPEFVSYVLELLTAPGATTSPRIVICVRDSLLPNNDDLRDLSENYPGVVETYGLLSWGTESRRRFAGLRLGDKADAFMRALAGRRELDALAATPYYCALLADLYDADALRDFYSESDLLAHALSSIIQREYDKNLVDPAVASESNVLEFLESLALVDLENGFRGIDVRVVSEFAELTLPGGLPDDDYERFVKQFTQLALFMSDGQGRLRFAQEILEQYILGQALIRAFPGKHAMLRDWLSYRDIPREWITLRVVADHIHASDAFAALVPLLYDTLNRPVAFRNLLQIAVYAKDRPDALRLPDFSLERQDLSGLVFEDCDLSNMSFRGADLTNTVFRRCRLRDASLEDAILRGTTFVLDEDAALEGARFGDLTRFFSIRTRESGRLIDDHAAARKWFERTTRIGSKIVEPCPSAQQLRHLFGKFVRPSGDFRRSWLDRRGVLAGARYHDDPEQVLDAAVRAGYLLEGDRNRIVRPEAEPYSEVVNYMKDLRMSPGIRALLADVCKIDGCAHVPPPQ